MIDRPPRRPSVTRLLEVIAKLARVIGRMERVTADRRTAPRDARSTSSNTRHLLRFTRGLYGGVKSMKTTLLLVGLLIAAPAAAQTAPVPTAVEVLVLPAEGDPLTVLPVPNGSRITLIGPALNCGLPALPAGPIPLLNPTVVQLDDPFTPGSFCTVPLPTNLPNGTGYRAVAVFRPDPPAMPSRRSEVGVPLFDLQSPPGPTPPPTGVVVRP